MTWEEHLTELQRIHEACEHNQPLLPHSTYRMLMKHLAALEVDRYCKDEDPYRFLWGMSSLYTDFAPNPAECNAEGYPTTLREASKRLRSYEPTRWQVDRLLGYADWIQAHGMAITVTATPYTTPATPSALTPKTALVGLT